MLKLALAGGYGHCNALVKSALARQDVQFVAAAKWGPEDPTKYMGIEGVPKDLPLYDDYRTMLDKHQPDIVGVFMPFFRIAETARDSAERSCHLICEKPLATTLEGLSALREAVRRNGVRIAAFMSMRAQPSYQAVRKLIAEGRIGQPILAAAQKSYPFKTRDDFYKRRETYGGSIPWQAIHALDLIAYCTGRDFVRVAAMQSNEAHPTHPGMEDNGGILLELSGGGHAVIWFDYLRPWAEGVQRKHGDDRLRIAGSQGIIEVIEEGTRVQLMTPTNVEDVPLPPEGDLFASFVDSLKGDGEPLITDDESFRVTQVALMARQAADEGRLVELP